MLPTLLTSVPFPSSSHSSLASPCLARNFHKSVEKVNRNLWVTLILTHEENEEDDDDENPNLNLAAVSFSSQRMPRQTRLLIFIEFIL